MNEMVTIDHAVAVSKQVSKPRDLVRLLNGELSAQARQIGDIDWRSVGIELLAERVATGEAVVGDPQFSAIRDNLEAMLMPATETQIKRELGILFACAISSKVDDSLEVRVAMAVEDVKDERPPLLALILACRHLRRTSKWVSIPEILDALAGAGAAAVYRAKQIVNLPTNVDAAKARLQQRIEDELRVVKKLQADIEWKLARGWSVFDQEADLGRRRKSLMAIARIPGPLVDQVTKVLEPLSEFLEKTWHRSKSDRAHMLGYVFCVGDDGFSIWRRQKQVAGPFADPHEASAWLEERIRPTD